MDLSSKKSFIINIIYTVTVIGLIYFIYKFAIIYLLPFIIGLVLAYVLHKPSVKIAEKTKLKSGTVAGFMVVISYLLLLSVIFLILFFVYTKGIGFIGNYQNAVAYIQNLFDIIEKKYSAFVDKLPEPAKQMLLSTLSGMSEKAVSYMTGAISGFFTSFAKKLPAVTFSIIVTIIASCYMAHDYNAVKEFLISVIPDSKRKLFYGIKKHLINNTFMILKGYSILLCITFVELLVGFLVIGQKNAIVLAFIIAFVDIFPVLGTGTVLVPWAIVSILNGNTSFGIKLIVLYEVITLLRNYLEPKVVSGKIGIPPLVTLLIMFCGLKIFGFLGMITTVISLVIIVNLYKDGVIEL